MFMPSDRLPGSYVDLLNRMIKNLKRRKAADQVLQIMQQLFEQELEKEQVVLSRPERKRLFQQVTQTVLKDVLQKMDGAK